MTTNRRTPPEETTTINLPLFLVALPRMAKSQELSSDQSLPHCNQGRGVQISDWTYAVLQLPAVWPRLGKLCFIHTGMLQLPDGGRGETSPLQLPGLQIRWGKDVQNKVPENTQDYNAKSVLYKTHHSRYVLRGGAERQNTGPAAACSVSDANHSSWHNGNGSSCVLTPSKLSNQQVSQFRLQM
jgi:hypothetical protein